ncbi:unnamed protein product [Penicillium pancosmium]
MDWAEDIAGFRFQTKRDVAVLIGPGRANQGRSVAPEEFLSGCKYIWIFVVSPTRPRLSRQATGTCLLTNISMGKFTRDWRWLMDRRGVAERVYRIWESALQAHEDVLLPIYVSLLRKTPAPMDVNLAADLLLPSTVSRIWTYLLHESKGKEFFYCETSGAQDIKMIRETIGKRPVRLPQALWRLLRSTTPIRSAAEELSKLFQNAEVCSPSDNVFSRTVQKALRACFALLDSIQGIRLGSKAGSMLCTNTSKAR